MMLFSAVAACSHSNSRDCTKSTCQAPPVVVLKTECPAQPQVPAQQQMFHVYAANQAFVGATVQIATAVGTSEGAFPNRPFVYEQGRSLLTTRNVYMPRPEGMENGYRVTVRYPNGRQTVFPMTTTPADYIYLLVSSYYGVPRLNLHSGPYLLPDGVSCNNMDPSSGSCDTGIVTDAGHRAL